MFLVAYPLSNIWVTLDGLPTPMFHRHSTVDIKKIRMVLEQFIENLDETPQARQEARGILSKLNTLENCILLVFWSVVMERFQQTSIKLQSTNMDLNEAMKLLRSLNNYVSSLRDAFEDFEEKWKIKIGFENESVYKGDTQRKKQRSVKLSRNDSNSEDTLFSRREKFRITVFLPMIDHLLQHFRRGWKHMMLSLENSASFQKCPR